MTKWKQTLLATASGVVLAGSAYAADLPMKAAPPAFVPAANWTGGYIGAHIGVGSYENTCAASAAGGSDYSCSTEYYHSDHGRDINVLGGIQAGYDWQYGRSFVFGVVGDWTWTNLKTNVFNMSGSVSYESKVNWLASFRGRAGLALDDTLVYVTGGLGVGNFKENTGVGSAGEMPSFSKTLAGWVAGVGVEHKISRNWSVQFEYLRYDFGMNSVTYTDTSNTYTYHHNFTHVVDVGRIALNYRW